uniref:Uncharacterized protein n=1 Tax=Knipowitschia caucasica TaxID=637954 RepID=A0AAV2JLL5_KNICA
MEYYGWVWGGGGGGCGGWGGLGGGEVRGGVGLGGGVGRGVVGGGVSGVYCCLGWVGGGVGEMRREWNGVLYVSARLGKLSDQGVIRMRSLIEQPLRRLRSRQDPSLLDNGANGPGDLAEEEQCKQSGSGVKPTLQQFLDLE